MVWWLPESSIPATSAYHTTDPATNVTVGPQNTPVDIPAGGSQSFVIGFTPSAAFEPTEIALSFDCTNANPADRVIGLNAVVLSASETPVPDVVALASTLTGTGTTEIDLDTGVGVFAVATVNVGTASAITVSVDIPPLRRWQGVDEWVSVDARICQTDPETGSCLVGVFPPSTTSVTTIIGAGETPTFAVALTAADQVAFDPANNRIFVNFRDAAGVLRGSTSVAVKTKTGPGG